MIQPEKSKKKMMKRRMIGYLILFCGVSLIISVIIFGRPSSRIEGPLDNYSITEGFFHEIEGIELSSSTVDIIQITSFNGEVWIFPHDEDEIKIWVIKLALKENSLPNMQYAVERGDSVYRIYPVDPDVSISDRIDFIVYVPKAIKKLKVDSLRGPITIKRVKADIEVSTNDGDMDIESYGDFISEGTGGKMELLVMGRHYDIKTNAGEIMAKIPYPLAEDASISIKTLYGPVTVYVSPEVSANFDILSMYGEVLTDFPHEVIHNQTMIKLGEGTIPILIRTMGGKIEVKRLK